MEVMLVKTPDGTLRGSLEADREAIKALPAARDIRAKITQHRNYLFHKKFMALVRLGFDAFEPADIRYKDKTITPEKNFDEFRRYIIVKAGYFDIIGYPDGSVKVRAKSISFASMEPEDFEKLFNKTIDVLLAEVLHTYTKDDIDRVLANILAFGD